MGKGVDRAAYNRSPLQKAGRLCSCRCHMPDELSGRNHPRGKQLGLDTRGCDLLRCPRFHADEGHDGDRLIGETKREVIVGLEEPAGLGAGLGVVSAIHMTLAKLLYPAKTPRKSASSWQRVRPK